MSGHMTLYTSCLLICHVMRDQRKPCVGSHEPMYQLFTDMSRHGEIRGNLVSGHMTLCHVMGDQRKPCVGSHDPMYQLFTDMSRHGRSQETLSVFSIFAQ